jgi:hypothetical protein
VFARVYAYLDVERRARLLGRLLGSVGPLALAALAGGAFAKHLHSARWPEIPVSFDDAARATTGQVFELVRYVEQSDPQLVEDLLTALTQDGLIMTALGASLAAFAIRCVRRRLGAGTKHE